MARLGASNMVRTRSRWRHRDEPRLDELALQELDEGVVGVDDEAALETSSAMARLLLARRALRGLEGVHRGAARLAAVVVGDAVLGIEIARASRLRGAPCAARARSR